MRTAIVYGLLVLSPALRVWAQEEKPKQPEPQTQPGMPATPPPPPVIQSPKATIPAMGTPELDKPAIPNATDPLKMAPAPINPGTKPPGAAPVNGKTFIIGAEDSLDINVWGHPNLSGGFGVRPDGIIGLPLAGEIQAAGKTCEQLATEITERLKSGGYLVSPTVTVNVHQVNSRQYFLQGEVNKPGKYALVVPTTILEALVNAGGFRDFAKKSKIRIMRINPDKTVQWFNFDYNAVVKGKHLEQNILLEPGDQIIVK